MCSGRRAVAARLACILRRARSSSGPSSLCGWCLLCDSQMFYDARAFDQNIGGWNVASVSDMNGVCTCFPVAAMVRRTCVRI